MTSIHNGCTGVVIDDIHRHRRRCGSGATRLLRSNSAVELAGRFASACRSLAYFGLLGLRARSCCPRHSEGPQFAPHKCAQLNVTGNIDVLDRINAVIAGELIRVTDNGLGLPVQVIDRHGNTNTSGFPLGDTADPVDVGFQITRIQTHIAAPSATNAWVVLSITLIKKAPPTPPREPPVPAGFSDRRSLKESLLVGSISNSGREKLPVILIICM